MVSETPEIDEGLGEPLEIRSPRLKVGPGTNYPLQIRSGPTEKYPTDAADALSEPRSLEPEVVDSTVRATNVLGLLNSTGRSISIAIGRAKPSCQGECGDPWELAGWVNLEHGQTGQVNNPTGTRWCYVFAFDSAGTKWDGNFSARVLRKVFTRCWCHASTSPLEWEIGMVEVDLGSFPGGAEFFP